MVSAEDTEGPILASPYKGVPVAKFTARNVCEFLLPCAQENMKKGRCNWLVSFVLFCFFAKINVISCMMFMEMGVAIGIT